MLFFEKFGGRSCAFLQVVLRVDLVLFFNKHKEYFIGGRYCGILHVALGIDLQ